MVTDEVLRLYSEGLSLREIGETVGEHPQLLRKALIREGLAIKAKDRSESLEQYLNRETVTLMDDLIEAPVTAKEQALYKKLSRVERSLQTARNELNYHRSTKRKHIAVNAFGEAYRDIIEDVLGGLEFPEAVPVTLPPREPQELPDYGLVAVMSDIHLGELVGEDVPDNIYNYDIAFKRMEKFTDAIINHSRQSKNLVIADLKDILKGVIHGGMWETEGSVVESISKAMEMYITTLTKLSGVYEKVEVYSTGSNHERLTEHITTTNKHLDYGRLIDMMLTQIIEAKGWTNVVLHSTDSGYNLVNINDTNIILMHGDTLRTYKPTMTISRSKLQDVCLQLFDKPYRHAISGHTHEFVATSNQYKGLNIVNGTMVGNTSYGLQSGFAAIMPSQTLVFVEEDGAIENIKVVQF